MGFGKPFAFGQAIQLILDEANLNYFRLSNGTLHTIAQDTDWYYLAGTTDGVYPIVSPKVAAYNLNSNSYVDIYNGKSGFSTVSNSGGPNASAVYSGNYGFFGGNFTTYSGAQCLRLAKVNLTDGSLDPTFHATVSGFSSGANPRPLALVSGVLYVSVGTSGTVTYNGTTVTGHLLSINATNGSLINSPTLAGFTPSSSVVNDVVTSCVASSGYLYVGGSFIAYKGVGVSGVAKINLSTGNLDGTFAPSRFSNGTVFLNLIGNDLYASGNFASFSGTSTNFCRLNATTGARDATFTLTTAAFNTGPQAIVEDGTDLICGGLFTTYSGIQVGGFARINKTTKALAPGWATSGTTGGNLSIGGFIPISGSYLAFMHNQGRYLNQPSPGIAIVNKSNGALVKGIYPSLGFTTITTTSNMQPALGADDYANPTKFYYQHNGHAVGGTQREGLFKIRKSNLTLDNSFNTVSGHGYLSDGSTLPTNRIAVDSNYVYSYAGSAQTYSGLAIPNLVKLDKNTGAIQSFPLMNPSGTFGNMVLTDTYLYVLGSSNLTFSGIAQNYIYRIHLASGVVDPSFTGFSGGVPSINGLTVGNGNVYLSGQFNGTIYRGTTWSGTQGRILKISEATGDLDLTFNTGQSGVAFSGGFGMYHLRVDGNSLYVGGNINSFNGQTANVQKLAKFSAISGTLDPNFITGSGFNNNVYKTIIDGQYMYVGGIFTSFDGNTNYKGIVKLDKDTGALVSGFNASGSMTNVGIYDMTLTSGGNIFAVGNIREAIVSGSPYLFANSILIDKNTGEVLVP